MIGPRTTEATEATSDAGENQMSACERLRTQYRIAVLCGGNVTGQLRSDITEGRRAKVDVLEMERRLGAHIFDFGALRNSVDGRSRRLARLARLTRSWNWCLALYALPSLRDCDLIYTTGEDVGVPLALLLRLRQMTRPRLLMRLEQPLYGRTWWHRTLFSGLLTASMGRISLVLCRTRAHQHYLNEVMKVRYGRLTHLLEPVDITYNRPDAPVTDMDLPPRIRPRIVTAGLEMRDYGTLAEAVAPLDVEVVICAGSPWSHFTFGDDQKRALPPNILVKRFAPGQMRSVFATADLIVVPVLPTLRSCGISVILEAWCMEKPVIVTRTAGQMEQVTPGENGLFSEPFDAADLRREIRYLLEHPSEAARMGKNGRAKAVSSHSLDDFIEAIAQHSLNVLEEREERHEPGRTAR